MNTHLPTYHYLASKSQYFKISTHTIEVLCDYEEKPKNLYTIKRKDWHADAIKKHSSKIDTSKYNAVRDYILKIITTNINTIDNSVEPGPNS